MKRLLLILPVFLIVVSVKLYAASPNFFLLKDHDYKFFETVIETQDKEKFKITRMNVEGPYYDGPLGYNLFMIRKIKLYQPPDDVMTLLVTGQFNFFAYDFDRNLLYTYSNDQLGSEIVIRNIIVFSRDGKKRTLLSIPGDYQYASCSPDGRYCLLISNKVVVLDLREEKQFNLNLDMPLMGCEAAPTRFDESGKAFDGGSYELSGEYLEVKWKTNNSGNLILRGKNKKLIKEVEIIIK
ncbi:MAG: hypothetical protein KAW12_09590 [Candidatus Aminicenantes bacterium]|nr:hypothetical protein [Candidatus Aminicenantes bacterium]